MTADDVRVKMLLDVIIGCQTLAGSPTPRSIMHQPILH